MKEKEFKYKKKYGQNFIQDQNIPKKIVNISNIKEETLVIEVGPGAGALTKELNKKASHVLAYEIDEEVKPILEKNINKNTTVIYDNFLKRNIKEDLKKFKYKHLFLIANLPYYITTPIIIKVIEEKLNIEKIVVMVQKEVGDRFNAKPSTKEYNALSVYINYYYDIKKEMNISKNIFKPKPKVDSIVISMTKKEKNLSLINEDHFRKLVKDSFKQKRKTIKNNLKNYDLNQIEKILLKNNLNLSTRAEAIPIEVFVELSNSLNKITRT